MKTFELASILAVESGREETVIRTQGREYAFGHLVASKGKRNPGDGVTAERTLEV